MQIESRCPIRAADQVIVAIDQSDYPILNRLGLLFGTVGDTNITISRADLGRLIKGRAEASRPTAISPSTELSQVPQVVTLT